MVGFGHHQAGRELCMRKGSSQDRDEQKTWGWTWRGRREAEIKRGEKNRKKKKKKESREKDRRRERAIQRETRRIQEKGTTHSHTDPETQFLDPKATHLYPMQHKSHRAEAAGAGGKRALR